MPSTRYRRERPCGRYSFSRTAHHDWLLCAIREASTRSHDTVDPKRVHHNPLGKTGGERMEGAVVNVGGSMVWLETLEGVLR